MKRLLLLSLVTLCVIGASSLSFAQSTLIHYWNFNTLATAYHNPGIPAIAADYSVLDTSKAKLVYVLEPGAPANYSGYLDNVASAADSNLRMGAVAGQALRIRNPTDADSMELRLYIPSTNYNNLALTYELEASSTTSGQHTEVFSYSTDSGATWKTAQLWVNGLNVDTLDVTQNQYQGTLWGLVHINFGSDTTVNNNPKLVLKIQFQVNTDLSSGNNRFDDITLDGTYIAPAGPTITVKTPTAGATLIEGLATPISFSTSGNIVAPFALAYSTNGGTIWVPIASDPSSATPYNWTVPNSPSATAMVKVTDANNVTGKSGTFTIEGPGSVSSVTVPASVYEIEPALITWSATGGLGTTVNIDVSFDNKTTWSPVVANFAFGASSEYLWHVPHTAANGVIIRLTFASGSVGYSNSFNIISGVGHQEVVQYWDFNGLSAAYHNPGIPAIPTDYSASDAGAGRIVYYLEPSAPSNYSGYIDNVAGDTTNAQLGAAAGQGLRVRNPSSPDSMELRFYIPTTNYNNVAISYALQSSSETSGQLAQYFDYSLDSGKTWQVTGISVNGANIDTLNLLDTIYQMPVGFGLVKVGISNPAVGNTSKLVFRIKFGANSSGSGGNNRFDNFTVTGDQIFLGVKNSNIAGSEYSVYPNPSGDHFVVSTPSSSLKTIIVSDVLGRSLLTLTGASRNIPVDASSLHAGVYFVRVLDGDSGAAQTIKFVKK